jgi:hypothetical protein
MTRASERAWFYAIRKRRGRLTRALLLVVCVLGLAGCKKPYRVGEYVWVSWENGEYPAYLIERKGTTRFRVHFEGYDPRWDEDVTLERIRGRIEGPALAPPPPEKVAKASGLLAKGGSDAGVVATYKIGDRVRVRWRGSVYPATITGVVSSDRFLVHYDGYESAWDEVVESERIAGTRL